MATIFHLDLSGLPPAQAILKTSALLENGHREALTVGLSGEAAAIAVADFLRSVGLETQSYRQKGRWLVLGHPAGSPEILVWHGPDGWQAAVDDREREPILDLAHPLDSGRKASDRPGPAASPDGGTVVMAGSRFMGTGDEELGARLAVEFFETLAEFGPPVKTIVFYNTGVFLPTREPEVIRALRELAGQGTELISCGLCLEHYKLKNSLRAGRVGRMRDLIEAQRQATHVIHL